MIAPGLIPSLSGRTILVRPGEEEDSAVAALRSHPEIRRYLPWRPAHFSVEEARKLRIAREADETRISFHIHLSANGTSASNSKTKFAGMASITHMIPEFKSCEMGILVSPECFRGGVATDALHTLLAYVFETMKFHRVGFITSANNVGMRGWLDKAGATLEGTTREGWSDGKGGFTDVCLYGILDREWAETVKPRLEQRINRAIGG